jgi:hypothetical protein
MNRFARGGAAPTVVLFSLLLGVAATAAEQSPEVGYVEDLDHVTAADAIVRAGGNAALELLAPIRDGDAFSLSDPKAKVTLRLAGQVNPVIVWQANKADKIAASPPTRGFFTSLLSWVGSSIVVFDRSQRTQMTAAIRGDGGDKLAAPILDMPQVLAAGRRPFAIGWLTPDVISIRLSMGGKTIAEGKGVGGLWIGPEVDFRPGKYVLALKSAGAVLSQQVTVTAASDIPQPPDDLARTDIPGALGETAKGVWFAAAGKQYLLEALQHVAADSDEFKPADILVDALIAGRQPSPPP